MMIVTNNDLASHLYDTSAQSPEQLVMVNRPYPSTCVHLGWLAKQRSERF